MNINSPNTYNENGISLKNKKLLMCKKRKETNNKKKINKNKKYLCELHSPPFSFVNKFNLNKHIKKYHKEKLQQCRYCKGSFYPIINHENFRFFKYKKEIEIIPKEKEINENELNIESVSMNSKKKFK